MRNSYLKKALFSTAMLTITALYAVSPQQTVYEDAELGTVDNWQIAINSSASAAIVNTYDVDKGSKVIQFTANGLEDGFLIGNHRVNTGWNNTSAKNIEWSMKYSENVSVYIILATSNGTRYLKYTNSDNDNGMDRGNIHHGLGSNIIDGTWRTFNRDLEADLQEFDPTNSIIAVNGLLIRGAGSVDDIKLIDTPIVDNNCTTYEDSESGLITNWNIYVNTSGLATVMNVYDNDKASKVIKVTGDGIMDGYMIGANRGSERWNNSTEKTLTWSMKYSEDVNVYVAVSTMAGTRYLKYTNSDNDNGIDRGNIHHGLGSNIIDGTWQTFTRDLEADLQEFEPTNSIVAVNAFMIRGSGSIDDIKLCSSSMPPVMGNQAPIANAGVDQIVEESTQVTLDASNSSDADADPLTYVWTMTSKPNGSNASLSDATVVNPTFAPDVVGDYVIELIVNDGQMNSVVDTVTISANVLVNKILNVCDVWSVSNSGGSAGTVDNWDISQIPLGATFDFEFQAYSVPDKFKVAYPLAVIQLDSGWRGSYAPSGEVLAGPGTLNLYGLFPKQAENTMLVQVSGQQPGTGWNYRVRCNLPAVN